MREQKRALAIHDISCVGRCSLTVALPILSAAGAECSILPTAVLSTHTGGFEGYTFRDLTDDMPPIVRHWRSLELRFDAIYTGYLGSARQLEIVAQTIGALRDPNTRVFLDPVMGDGGRLYAGFPPDFPDGMRALCRHADVILPNMTEAALLLGREFRPGPYRPDAVRAICEALGVLHGGQVVLTGVYFEEGKLGAAVYDARTDAFALCLTRRLPFSMPGTGDVFASAFVAACLAEQPLRTAAQTAADFTALCMERTKGSGRDLRFGPCFEPALPDLMRALGVI